MENKQDRFDRLFLFFDRLFETVGNILLSLIRRLAPFAVPMSPAFFFGRAVFHAAGSPGIGLAIGIIAALGLESGGIMAAHKAIQYYTNGDPRRALAAGLTAVYLTVGIGAIWLLESAPIDAKLTGSAMFMISGIVYILIGLDESDRAAQRAQEAKRAQEAAQRAQEAAQEAQRAQVTAETERAKIEAETAVKIAEIEAAQRAQEAKTRIRAQERIEKARQLSDKKPANLATRSDKKPANLAETSRQDNGGIPADWRQLSPVHKELLSGKTGPEIAGIVPGLSASAARGWARRLRENGDKLPAISSNGHK